MFNNKVKNCITLKTKSLTITMTEKTKKTTLDPFIE